MVPLGVSLSTALWRVPPDSAFEGSLDGPSRQRLTGLATEASSRGPCQPFHGTLPRRARHGTVSRSEVQGACHGDVVTGSLSRDRATETSSWQVVTGFRGSATGPRDEELATTGTLSRGLCRGTVPRGLSSRDFVPPGPCQRDRVTGSFERGSCIGTLSRAFAAGPCYGGLVTGAWSQRPCLRALVSQSSQGPCKAPRSGPSNGNPLRLGGLFNGKGRSEGGPLGSLPRTAPRLRTVPCKAPRKGPSERALGKGPCARARRDGPFQDPVWTSLAPAPRTGLCTYALYSLNGIQWARGGSRAAAQAATEPERVSERRAPP
ncbi:hypothetical protein M885DRAFT_173708 [Pelagophyceae sp. CCMP2097]|nr:hypothetical protein M885DRAFT_173708 [Pelagophyceae sp. CCMP2097]